MSDDLNLVPCEETIDDDIAKERIIQSIGDYLDKLIILEESLGYTVEHYLLDPETLNLKNTWDVDELNSVANKIANFINLESNVFVNIEQLSKDTGGSISTSSGYEAVININRNVLRFKESTLCVLAHELTHQYLYINGIDLTQASIFG